MGVSLNLLLTHYVLLCNHYLHMLATIIYMDISSGCYIFECKSSRVFLKPFLAVWFENVSLPAPYNWVSCSPPYARKLTKFRFYGYDLREWAVK